ncbi:MAG: glutamate-5-semialdehyde dehydrogenase [Lachnospiraceae bacterium]|nr:glutamate-5-semialdehyde dehydrogenase [Lachnospiraceae bacterium]
MNDIGMRAKAASKIVRNLSTDVKNECLKACAQALMDAASEIIEANKKDLELARENGMSEALLDRLAINEKRIRGMAEGILTVASLKDPVGEVISMENRPNGLMIGKKRVPLGVIAIIYESRPNVTSDAFALAFKAGNAVILRGGSDAIESIKAISDVIRKTLTAHDVDSDACVIVDKTDRSYVNDLLTLNKYIDVIIPRGGAGLINNVVENATVPVIQTGVGNCHIYVDKAADLDLALDIIENAKTQRLGVCNACESLVVHSEIYEKFLPMLYERLMVQDGVEIRADERAREIVPEFVPATDEDYYKEYLDKIISLKIVDHCPEAIEWINAHSTGHSEAIISKNYNHAMRFLNEVDSAAVYVNASTRFTDGGEFGMGAEIGISTQKLHARGPLGLQELTTIKYIIFGSGQIRK